MTKPTLYNLVLPIFLAVALILTVLSCSKKSSDPVNPTTLTLTTTAISAITSTAATGGGNITSDGGSGISARGVCWSVAQNPTLSDNHTSDGSGSGTFTSNITGLIAGTNYYLRAYATNQSVTAYGNQVTFKTSTLQQPPVVTTAAVSIIAATTATSGGNVTTQGSTGVTARGICWGLSKNPTISDTHTTDGKGTGLFTSNLTGLTPNSVYYLRAYATNSIGTAYGSEVSFTSQGLPPSLTTTAITNITQTTATGGGNVTAQGSFPVTAKGVCWSTSQNPTIDGNHTVDGAGTGSFTSNITQLTLNTTYYLRSYATSSCGTGYGDQVTFTTEGTSALPVVILQQITNITANAATVASSVTSEGGSTVTMRGVCWSNTPNPTIANSHTTDGAGLGPFISEMTSLLGEMVYYVRSYATNSSGTTYTMQITFETLQSFICGDTIHYGGQVYHTLSIGTQCWLKENLNIGTQINGSQNQTDNNIIEKYCYQNLDSNCTIYGGLYQWNELVQYTMPLPANQGICPNAWHITSDAEFTTLFNFLGGITVAGGKLKEEGTTHWGAPNTGATNSSGFTALPAGYRHSTNQFIGLSLNSYMWTTPKYGSTQCWTRRFDYNSAEGTKILMNRVDGMSVRCIKN